MAAALLQNRWLVGAVTAGRGTLVRIVVLDFLHLLANQRRFRAVLLVVGGGGVHRNRKKKKRTRMAREGVSKFPLGSR